jgi:hypothetical protein
VKSASGFGEAEDNQEGRQAHYEVRERSGRANKPANHGGQDKDARANDAVDSKRC